MQFLLYFSCFYCNTDISRLFIKTQTERRNWTELTRFSFWRTEQWASRASPLVIS